MSQHSRRIALAPIALFTFKRPFHTRRTLEALTRNVEFAESPLFIYCDGARNEADEEQVEKTRQLVHDWPHPNKTVIERELNCGLANSIIVGVTEICRRFGRVVVVEDDILTASNFLAYMNQALNFYQDNPKIWAISGFSYPMKSLRNLEHDATFGFRASSWGWASWGDRWDKVDWEVTDYADFMKDRDARARFKLGGSDLCRMLRGQMRGKINSWAIRFCYAQFRNEMYDVFPKVSKTISIGFDIGATHTTGQSRRFQTTIDDGQQRLFSFPSNVKVDNVISREFASKFSLLNILKHKFF